jgi:hypothetical protein
MPAQFFTERLASCCRRGLRVLGLALAVVSAPGTTFGQTPPSPWPADIELRRTIPPDGLPPGAATPTRSAPPASPPATAPRPPAEPPREASRAAVRLSAHLTQDGEPIDQGLVWRVFTEPKAPAGAEATRDGAKPALVATHRDAMPLVQLPPGAYVINVTYGRAHLTRRIAVTAPGNVEERFVINAGGLRVTALLAGGEKPPDLSVSYDIYTGDADQLGGRTRLIAGLRPGIVVRLNAGLYHLVSTLGDANAVVSADVTVEAGKLTDAVLSHRAARITLKLVTRAGGEAQADTQWAVHNMQGELVRESQGALPTHILAAGEYVANARHGGRLYQRQFTVAPGEPAQIEVVMQ